MIVTVFDTETTGLIDNHTLKLARQPEVIEFACVQCDWDMLNIKDQFEVMIKPSQPLPDKTKEVTNITDEKLAHCLSFAAHADTIAAYLTQVDIVCGHNLSYDMEVMDFEFERLGRKLFWPEIRICTVEQTMHVNGNRIKLGDLYKMLTGLVHEDAHRAMPDVLATLVCLKGIRDKGWI